MDIVYGDGMAFSDNYSIGGAPWAYDPTFVLDRRDGRSTFYVRFDVSGTEARYDRLSWLPETAGDDGGADLIFTGAGNDIALGDYGKDRLDLGSGNDTGIGGHDDDIVDGGAGNDQLFGDFNWDAGEGPQGETANMTMAILPGRYMQLKSVAMLAANEKN